ncbi:DUF6973 domain-containing protein [Psychroflexus tropicus]|uniref:DUF6973 domain-containing protein n=1 Tax=Psychroflexus tropicus TaxID=197345 RepID=UPI00037B3B35|nr:hypothetical protein [Psychroflexus tropicus]
MKTYLPDAVRRVRIKNRPEHFLKSHSLNLRIIIEKGSKLLKNGCVAAREECFNDVQDPCECDGNDGCVEENDEVPINVFPINIMLVSQLNSLLDQNLLPTQVQAMGPYGDELFQQMIDFLNENSTIEAQNFIHAVVETIEEVGSEGVVEVDFEDHLSDYDFREESAEILVFEQDYRNDMSQTELSIFNDLSRFQQLDYLHSAYLAFFYAEIYFEDTPMVQYNGKGDAYRHALWNALGAAKLGESLMEQLASAHEEKPFEYPYHYKEKEMDLFNNQVGRNIGNQSIFMLMMKIKFASDRGELRYLSHTNPEATSNSQLIPTNL